MPALLDALRGRTAAVVAALTPLDRAGLEAPSLLPGWSRLTVACHLRFGARTLQTMTDDALEGRPTSFYPLGRDLQREATLEPDAGEAPLDVPGSLGRESARLAARWARLHAEDWAVEVREPDENPDLGAVPLARLALLRLTEVEVHGSDLDLGLPDWSDTFVDLALPFRLGWVAARRPPGASTDVEGTWIFAATDRALTCRLSLSDGRAEAAFDAGGGARGSTAGDRDAVFRGTGRDLLALLLGRPRTGDLSVDGDAALAAAFKQAFPGP